MKKRRSLIPLEHVQVQVGDTFVVRRLYKTAYTNRLLVRFNKQYHSVWGDKWGMYHLKNGEKEGKK